MIWHSHNAQEVLQELQVEPASGLSGEVAHEEADWCDSCIYWRWYVRARTCI